MKGLLLTIKKWHTQNFEFLNFYGQKFSKTQIQKLSLIASQEANIILYVLEFSKWPQIWKLRNFLNNNSQKLLKNLMCYTKKVLIFDEKISMLYVMKKHVCVGTLNQVLGLNKINAALWVLMYDKPHLPAPLEVLVENKLCSYGLQDKIIHPQIFFWGRPTSYQNSKLYCTTKWPALTLKPQKGAGVWH
jgi:hypothetical protein